MLGRWRRRNERNGVFNQPPPPRKGGPSMVLAPQHDNQGVQPSFDPQPGGRVARMTALEGDSSDSPSYGNTAALAGGRRYGDTSESEGYGEVPEHRHGERPVTGKRNGSLSSQSMLGGLDTHDSPLSGSGQLSSPEGTGSGQSEQLPTFKDYYSQDEIHPGDKVATLWAYQPRAGDEFALERGDMLQVVGIWDDGWATGIRINDRAETYDAKRKLLRDSGVSNGTSRRVSSPPPNAEVKAFPVSQFAAYLKPMLTYHQLVCVCLPEHWKSTVEGDANDGSDPPTHPAGLNA
ncbi:MAG: hypothetical protein Q9214_000597 [Letrouitia sp. 1 TL-2023]